MKLSIISTVLLMFFGSALVELPSSTSQTANSEIKGTVILSPKSNLSRFGGGLYGRPRASSAVQAFNDSALVILIGMGSSDVLSTNSPVVLDQKDQKFSPNLLPVEQNEKIRIRNSDPVYHNVFSLSSTKKFDVGRRPKGEYLDVTFDKPGIVDVFCDIHSNMHAVVYVMPSNTVSWIKVKSGENFTIPEIPQGNYELKVYANGYEEQSLSIQVTANEPADIGTITLNS